MMASCSSSSSSSSAVTSSCSSSARKALSVEQKARLAAILHQPVCIAPLTPSFPKLEIVPSDLMRSIRDALARENIELDDVRLEGSAAALCIAEQPTMAYNDLDLVFHIKSQEYEDLCKIRSLLCECLVKYVAIPVDPHAIGCAYLQKMFITPLQKAHLDAWALFSLPGYPGFPSLDFKFVQRCARPYQFSIDSFQVILTDRALSPASAAASSVPLTAVAATPADSNDAVAADGNSSSVTSTTTTTTTPEDVLGEVLCESAYGDVERALVHLHKHQIAVREPSHLAELHGGGLLKYCRLLAQQYTVAEGLDTRKMETYMCTRFRIDFPNTTVGPYGLYVQMHRIQEFMRTHIAVSPANPAAGMGQRIAFLSALHCVVHRAGGRDSNPLLHITEMLLAEAHMYMPYVAYEAAAQPTAAAATVAAAAGTSTAPSTTTTTTPATTVGTENKQSRSAKNKKRKSKVASPPLPARKEHPEAPVSSAAGVVVVVAPDANNLRSLPSSAPARARSDSPASVGSFDSAYSSSSATTTVAEFPPLGGSSTSSASTTTATTTQATVRPLPDRRAWGAGAKGMSYSSMAGRAQQPVQQVQQPRNTIVPIAAGVPAVVAAAVAPAVVPHAAECLTSREASPCVVSGASPRKRSHMLNEITNVPVHA